MPSRYQTPRQPELVIEIPACLEFPFLCLLLKEWHHLVRKATPQASAGEDDWQSSSQAAPVSKLLKLQTALKKNAMSIVLFPGS